MAFLNLTGLKYFYDKISAIFAKDSEVVKSVNNITPTDGHVHVARVDYADNLVADDAQASSGTFIARTSGGDASISDGDASLTTLKGTSQHTGYSAGSLSMAVYPVSSVPRSETITVSSDSATFKNQIRNDATVTFTYTGSWNVDPVSYGVTVTGTPESGDSVTATYVKSTDTTNVSVDADSSGITATVNASTFKDAILEDTTVVLSYSSAWNYNPATYGLTVTGTPLSGDVITAVYTKSSDTLNVTTTLVPTEPRTGTITATIDEDVWSFSGASSGATTFTYTTEWNANLSTYGITVTGSPVSGDSIVVDYTPEVRGTITHPQLGSFVSTGWNLYDDSVGYARCLKYSDSYGFLIGGLFTSIGFTTDPSLPAETIAPVEVSEGVYSFDINDDGFVMVTDGDDTTYIMMTWSDWTEGYEGDFETYRASEIDLSSLSAFPYGLMAAGAIADEIDFTYGTYTSRVGRMTYNYSNLMTAKNSGRAYEYDEDYIYFEKEIYESSDFVIDPAYTVSDHGIEFFTGTDTPFWASMLYGQNLKDKLRTDVLTISAQDLTSTQKTQVKTNLGLVSDLAGKKNTQTAVSDPSASGTSTTFIATLTQNAQGVITPTKKTVSTMGAATSSAAGTAGLVPAPASGEQSSFLRGDGTWATPTNTKNTAGSTNSTSKLFLVGATSQTANPVTYSNVSCYASGGYLYSGGSKVSTSDTKNTAGATNSTKKIFLVGPTSQEDDLRTYSNVSCYASGGYLYSGGDKVLTSATDTKNTAGTTNTTSKIYLAGATSQTTNPVTYSNVSCYASGGYLYSGSSKVLTAEDYPISIAHGGTGKTTAAAGIRALDGLKALLSGQSLTTTATQYSLADSLADYTMLLCYITCGGYFRNPVFVMRSHFSLSNALTIDFSLSGETRYVDITYVNATAIKALRKSTNAASLYIYGINL